MLGKHCSAEAEQGMLMQLGGILPLQRFLKVTFEMHFGSFRAAMILSGVVSPGQQ
jgi:hypothetical protein